LTTIDLGGTWRFRPQRDADPVPIEVPGFWEARGFLDLDGTATYERTFELPESVGFATVEFDAVADLCRVFVNDVAVGGHEVGFTPFALDVTAAVSPGSNELRVEVDDPARGTALHLHTIQGKQGWGAEVFPSPPSIYVTVGGIWQPCRMVVHGPVYIDDLSCDMDPVEPTVGVHLVNRSVEGVTVDVVVAAFDDERKMRVDIAPREGVSVFLHFDGSNTARWSPEAPHLHDVHATAHVDGVVSHARNLTTGLRSLRIEGGDVLIDDRPYRMRSALHQGYWPRGIYSADAELIDRDVELALASGFNTLRLHLKAFEPRWLDAADRAGLLLHCDTPIGEPLDPEQMTPDSDYGRRCLLATREQLLRDRSRPSIVMWTLMNEIGLSNPEILPSSGYRDLVERLHFEVRTLDPDRPIIENDGIAAPEQLIASDIRSPHWYGRASLGFIRTLESQLDETSESTSPLYVSEFGEWGLPAPEQGSEFFDNEAAIRSLLAETGWAGTYESFVSGTQTYQGWAGRIQAERMRTRPQVKGFCITEWTDVPHELNGLLSIRREPKKAAIDALAPALADIVPIATLDRFAFTPGERLRAGLVVSNWSRGDLPATEAMVGLGDRSTAASFGVVAAGGVSEERPVTLEVPGPGSYELVVTAHDHRSVYPVAVHEPPPPGSLDVHGSTRLTGALRSEGWSLGSGPLLVAEGALDDGDLRSLEADVDAGATVVVLAQESSVPLFGALEAIPQWWGPSPFAFTTMTIAGLSADRVLTHEIFHCFPEHYLPERRGPIEVLIPPPTGRRGALVAARAHGRGRIVVCQLRIEEGLCRHGGWELRLLADLVTYAGRL
jgi:hypothetical protein